MTKPEHLRDCAAFLSVFLYENAKIFVDTRDLNVVSTMGPLYAAIVSLMKEYQDHVEE